MKRFPKIASNKKTTSFFNISRMLCTEVSEGWSSVQSVTSYEPVHVLGMNFQLSISKYGNGYFQIRKWVFPNTEMGISKYGNGYFQIWKWVFPNMEMVVKNPHIRWGFPFPEIEMGISKYGNGYFQIRKWVFQTGIGNGYFSKWKCIFPKVEIT